MSFATLCAKEGDVQLACDISSEAITFQESELEHFSKECKLSVVEKRDRFLCYKLYCNYLIDLGKDFDALLAAERGRARVLRELLTKKYAIQETDEPVNEKSFNSLIGSLTQEHNLVFVATISSETVFWVTT